MAGMRSLLVLCLLACSVLAERVSFKTEDGVEIVGTWHPTTVKDAPTVICLPMYRNVRGSYKPLVAPFTLLGMNVLAIDLRGHGDSAPALKRSVEQRDAKVFNAMHLDVKAAIEFVERAKGCDRTRIGLIGASVGCSVTIDATRRYPGDVRAAAILTPGAKYLGVDSLAHIKQWPGTRIFTFVSSEEEKKSAPVMKALDAFDGSNYVVLPGKGIHGTRMFGKVNEIEQLLANFFASSLIKNVDLRVREGVRLHRRSQDLEAWVGITPTGCEAWVKAPFKGSITFQFDKKRIVHRVDWKRPKAEQVTMDGRIRVAFPRDYKPGEHVTIKVTSTKGKALKFPSRDRFVLQSAGRAAK